MTSPMLKHSFELIFCFFFLLFQFLSFFSILNVEYFSWIFTQWWLCLLDPSLNERKDFSFVKVFGKVKRSKEMQSNMQTLWRKLCSHLLKKEKFIFWRICWRFFAFFHSPNYFTLNYWMMLCYAMLCCSSFASAIFHIHHATYYMITFSSMLFIAIYFSAFNNPCLFLFGNDLITAFSLRSADFLSFIL